MKQLVAISLISLFLCSNAQAKHYVILDGKRNVSITEDSFGNVRVYDYKTHEYTTMLNSDALIESND